MTLFYKLEVTFYLFFVLVDTVIMKCKDLAFISFPHRKTSFVDVYKVLVFQFPKTQTSLPAESVTYSYGIHVTQCLRI